MAGNHMLSTQLVKEINFHILTRMNKICVLLNECNLSPLGRAMQINANDGQRGREDEEGEEKWKG